MSEKSLEESDFEIEGFATKAQAQDHEYFDFKLTYVIDWQCSDYFAPYVASNAVKSKVHHDLGDLRYNVAYKLRYEPVRDAFRCNGGGADAYVIEYEFHILDSLKQAPPSQSWILNRHGEWEQRT